MSYEEHEADDEQDVGLMRRHGLWEMVDIDRSPALLIFILRSESPLRIRFEIEKREILMYDVTSGRRSLKADDCT